MELDEFFPKSPTFFLNATKKEYELRPPNLEDTAWVKQNLGSEDEITKMFDGPDWNRCIKFVYRLLKDKSDFMAEVEKQVDDLGEEVEVKVSGPQKLLRAVTGQEEGMRVLAALTKAISIANPMVEKMVEKEKKNLSTGSKSSTKSRPPTGGRSKK